MSYAQTKTYKYLTREEGVTAIHRSRQLTASQEIELNPFGARLSITIRAFVLRAFHALDESKRREGARLIHQYQHLIDRHEE